MPKFVLEVDLGTSFFLVTATLSIYTDYGTNPPGYGWEWLGRGMNIGGVWEWHHVGKYFMGLKDKTGSHWGYVDADWSKLETPEGYPPKPWLSHTGVSSGTVELQSENLANKYKWRLK